MLQNQMLTLLDKLIISNRHQFTYDITILDHNQILITRAENPERMAKG